MAAYKRLGRKGRHLLRQLRRSRHASVQRTLIHELKSHVSGRHGFRHRAGPPDVGKAGRYRPLTHKAKQLMTRLRKARIWSVQKRIISELEREIERGKRLAERIRKAKAARAARQAARRARQMARAARRGGRRLRDAVRRGHGRHLDRAERLQRERAAGTRRPPVTERIETWYRRKRRTPRTRPGGRRHAGSQRPAPGRTRRAPSARNRARTPRAPRTPRKSRPARTR